MAGKVARVDFGARARGRGASASSWQLWALTGLEALAWVAISLIAVVLALGVIAQRFAGADRWSDSLAFAGGVLLIGVGIALLARGWLLLRRFLGRYVSFAPAAAAVLFAAAAAWFATGERFREQAQSFRTMVGAKEAAARSTIAHQVFAAYRRLDLGQMEVVLERSRVFEPTIEEAAKSFEVEPEVLVGVGATESSFYPRKSADGGEGIFQITAAPASAARAVRERLKIAKLDPLNQRHNAFLGAATLRQYLDEMKSDLFLGLLAYNIGPRNGGLRTIMKQYGARDFTTIQPYLQNLPREYPIRVLSAALAYRVWRTEGRLARYEKEDNAKRIQRIGIPGIDTVAEKTG